MTCRVPRLRRLRSAASGLLLLLGGCGLSDRSDAPPAPPAPGPPRVAFVEVAVPSGLDGPNVSGSRAQRFISESASAGSAFLDYDGDGFQDIFLVNGTRPDAPATNRLFRNVAGEKELARAFEPVDVDLGASGWGMGCAVGDIDNDGDPDIYSTYLGPNRLYLNEGGERFPDVAASRVVADRGWGASAAFGDLDGDGYLDLYVTNYVEFDLDDSERHGVDCPYKGLPVFCGPGGFVYQPDKVYRNEGDRFTDASALTGVADHAHPGLGVVMADLDADGDLDLYVANDTAPNLLFRNDGAWRFVERALPAGVAFSGDGRDQAGMGVDAGDYDNDGRLDLFVTNFADDVNTLYRNESGAATLRFTDFTYRAGLGGAVLPYLGWGAGFVDYDGDGWLDLYVVNGHLYPQLDRYDHGLPYAQRNLLYKNEAGRFSEVGKRSGSPWMIAQVSRSAAVGDYDNDGDDDLLVVNLNDLPNLVRNEGGNRNSWLGLQLQGSVSNRDGIGARVAVVADGRRQVREVRRAGGFQASHDPRLRFGLGTSETVERVEISWPSGRRQVLAGPPVRRYLIVREEKPGWVALAAAESGRSPVAAAIDQGVDTSLPALPAAVENWSSEAMTRHTGRLFREARYEEVKTILEAGLDRDPEALTLRFLLGQVLVMGLGEYERGAEELERAVRAYPTAVDAHFYLGRAYLRLDRLPAAIASFRRASELVPGSWEYLHELGQAYNRADSLAAAEAALQRAVDQAPWHPGPHLQLVEVYRDLGQQARAREHQEQFARLFPVQEQAKGLEKRVKAEPGNAAGRTELGAVYLAQGRARKALEQFNAALRLDPDVAAAHAGAGSALYQAGRVGAAIQAWEASLLREPDQPWLRERLANARKQGR